jgi:uncharacterized protein (DUF1778 family)
MSVSRSKTERINLRTSLAAKAPAESTHKSVSEFILDASLNQAHQTLADRRVFKLDDKAGLERISGNFGSSGQSPNPRLKTADRAGINQLILDMKKGLNEAQSLRPFFILQRRR